MDNFDLRKYLAESKLTQGELNEENLEEGWKEWVAGGLLALTTLAGIGKAYAPKMDQLDSGDKIELAQNAYADAFKKMSNEDVNNVYTQVYKSDIKDDLKQTKFTFTSNTDKETINAAWPDMQRASLENAVAKHLDRFVISPDGTVTFVSNPGGFQAIKEEEKPPTKMKRKELKEMIKSAFLAEADFTNAQDDDAALGGMYDPVYEGEEEESLDDILARVMGTKADPYMAEDLAEAEEKEEEVDIKIDDKEEIDGGEEKASDSIVVDKKIVSLSSLPSETRKILDSLETLRAQAEEFGDQKFITQVGNTITFFTRDFVVAGDAPNPAGIEESLEILKIKKLAGLLTEGEYAKALLRKEERMLNEDNLEIKSIAKKLYSFLKQNGIGVSLETSSPKNWSKIGVKDPKLSEATIFVYDDPKTKQTIIQISLRGNEKIVKDIESKLLSTYTGLEQYNRQEYKLYSGGLTSSQLIPGAINLIFDLKEKTTAKGGLVGNTQTNKL